ncbi:MAG: hybrid sensor histidine kinase/response regulator [bacterium]
MRRIAFSELFIVLIIVATLLVFIAIAINLFLRKLIKKRTMELEKEKKFLSYVLEATKTNINITDADFNLQFVDLSWQKTYGNPSGRKCFEYFMGRDVPCEDCGMPEAIKTKAMNVYEEVMPHENNRVVEVHTIPFQDTDGRWLFAEFNVDITRRKRAEDALQTAERLESLGILAGGIAHDFNNLLAGIFGNIEMAKELSENSEAIDYLKKAAGAIERTKNLTAQLLTFAKGGEPIKKKGNIGSFLKETVFFALSGSKISCEFDIADNLSLCEFDKNQINQVVDNLVINARQAMSNKGFLKITAENIVVSESENPGEIPGNYVKISIKDGGCGIPGKILPKIFDPFFSTKPNGVGLGPATSYSIIKRHGGFIKVTSNAEKGTVFSFFLPSVEGELVLEVKEKIVPHVGRGEFIVMDDQEIIRLTTGKMLETLGYTAVYKEEGALAVEYFLQNKSKVKGMIFDLTVPEGMGGLEATAKIRELDKEIPIFVSSGYTEDEVMADPYSHGFTASISKPFTKDELVEMLNRYIPR